MQQGRPQRFLSVAIQGSPFHPKRRQYSNRSGRGYWNGTKINPSTPPVERFETVFRQSATTIIWFQAQGEASEEQEKELHPWLECCDFHGPIRTRVWSGQMKEEKKGLVAALLRIPCLELRRVQLVRHDLRLCSPSAYRSKRRPLAMLATKPAWIMPSADPEQATQPNSHVKGEDKESQGIHPYSVSVMQCNPTLSSPYRL